MDYIIEKIKNIDSLYNLNLKENVDENILFLSILKANRYDLLKNSNIKIHIDNTESSIKLIEYLLSNEDILYFINKNGFLFNKETIDKISKIVLENYSSDYYKFDIFLKSFFNNKEELNEFIKDNEEFFIKYLHNEKDNVLYILKNNDYFIKIILKEKYIKLINNIENYSLNNLKELATIINDGIELPYFLGNDRFMYHLFELKTQLQPKEFVLLLNLLKEKSLYDRKDNIFNDLINQNIEYLINLIDQFGILPKCLVESEIFRDQCIKRNRIDLAVKCILPKDIFKDENLVKKYSTELRIDLKDFYSRGKYFLDYYEKNNNIFNTLLATTLKNNIFNIGNEHLERFSNDISIQIDIAKLNDKESKIFTEILKMYNYEEFDISFMIANILNNISNYKELINSIDLSIMSKEDLKTLVKVLQLSNNQYNIKNIDDLRNYRNKKMEYLKLNLNKDSLLKLLFNINLNQAVNINNQYCYDRKQKILNLLNNSELPKEILEYLNIINKIIECNNLEDITKLYNKYKDINLYDLEIPLDTYLRSQYAKLYSNRLYKIKEDKSLKKINYNGKEIKIFIPRENFNFLIHCVGSCSLQKEIIDTNYQKDWEDRPQLQDHFIACSYINERGIYSIRSRENIILGFDSIESGSLFGMGDTDIDSIGFYSKIYNSSRMLMEENGNRAHYFVPSLIVNSINEGYNEIVIERRNCNSKNKEHFKRMPNYIIMMADSLDKNNFNFLEDLYTKDLVFLSEEDKKEINNVIDSVKIKKILIKYRDVINKNAKIKNMEENELLNLYVSLIIKSKYFEDCLKATSEFDIPLIIIDKLYYFNKILTESMYSEKEKNTIYETYIKSDEYMKQKIFNIVSKGGNINSILEKNSNFSITL